MRVSVIGTAVEAVHTGRAAHELSAWPRLPVIVVPTTTVNYERPKPGERVKPRVLMALLLLPPAFSPAMDSGGKTMVAPSAPVATPETTLSSQATLELASRQTTEGTSTEAPGIVESPADFWRSASLTGD